MNITCSEKLQLEGGEPVGYLQSVALDLKAGLPWNKSKWSERDSNPGLRITSPPLGHTASLIVALPHCKKKQKQKTENRKTLWLLQAV